MSNDQTYLPTGSVTIRRLEERDAPALAHLAGLDSEAALEAPAIGAEVEGRLLAAISLADGRTVSDPFSRTAELRSLLELRARQLRGRGPASTEGGTPIPRPRPRAALGSSPPGAGGRLLTLLPRF